MTIDELLGAVPLRPLIDSLIELSTTDEPVVEPTGAEPSIELPRPLSDEQSTEQSSVELSAELSSAELSSAEPNVEPIVETPMPSSAEPKPKPKPLSAELILPRPMSDERGIEQARAEPSTELSSAKPIAVPLRPLSAVSLRPIGDSLAELSSTEPIIEPTGAEPSIELPRPLSEEPSHEQLSAELSAELSNAESSSAEPIVELPMPSNAERSVQLPRPSSADVRGKWSRGKLLKHVQVPSRSQSQSHGAPSRVPSRQGHRAPR